MDCSACGHPNPDRARFCLECGSPFARRCASCGTELPAGARFCLECGTPLAAPAPPDQTGPERSPADYTPRHLADKILQTRSALEGERKQVTVLFADVKGSMELAGQLDPEAWHAVLDGFFNILTDGVHRFEGTVNQYTGDGIMALFGAPIAHEDHAQRACYAALHLSRALRAHALEVRRRHGLDFAFRMGLNSGEVVVGKIGDDLRMDYTAAGHCVGLAQRMESLAEAGSCYLTDATAALVSAYFELEDLGEFEVRGAEAPVRVHKLLGTGKARTRFDVSRSRGLTRFVGRDADMQRLEAALQRARRGEGAVLGVIAEAGTGKSRLCFEFVERCRAAGLNVYEGRAVSHGKSIPLVPVLEILRDYFGLEEGDDPRRAREKIAGRLLLLDDAFREVLPVLFEFLGVADPATPTPNMDPEARQRQLFGVTGALLRLTRAERPGVLLIEDLHWLDGPSEAWVRMWVDTVAGTHNLLLVNSRPEYRADWTARSHYQQLALAPLGPEAIRELLEALLGTDPSTAGLAEAIHERTRGNPFFAEEVVRSLIESGHLVGAPGEYRLRSPVTGLRVPESVQALLASRIDRLPEREKQLLQTAAVIGKEFREPILAAVCDLPAAELGDALARLRDAEFVYEESLYPVAEYAFKHPLTQEVALGSQLSERRCRTHAAVARAIEAFDAERLDEQAATLAHHWEEAGEHAPAAAWHARAARWALHTDSEEAYRHWTRVRELASGAPDAALRGLLGSAYLEIVNLGWRAGVAQGEAHASFEAARRLFEEDGDRHSLALLCSNYSLAGGGEHARFRVEASREAVRLAAELGDGPLQISVGAPIFPILYAGHLREGRERADRCMALIEEHGSPGPSLLHFDPLPWIHSARGYTRALLGDLAGGLRDSDRGLELARGGDDFDQLLAHFLRARLDGWRGALDDAMAHARREFELGEKVGGPANLAVSRFGLGHAWSQRGEWARALPLLEEGHALQLQIGGYLLIAGYALALAHCREPQRALDVAQELVAACANNGSALAELDARIELAQVLGLCGQEAAGRAALERARALADEMGCALRLPLLAEVDARLAQTEGSANESLAGLREAQRLYRQLGAVGHADRIAAELRA